MNVRIETDRLQLCEMSFANLDFVADMLAHPEVMRFYPRICSRDEAKVWIQRQIQKYADDGHGLWLVWTRSPSRRVGQVGLQMQEVDRAREPEIAYLIHYSFWRRGFATEAALGVRRYSFETLELPRVISLIRPDNAPSQAVAKKLGMSFERQTIFRDRRHLIFSVRRDGGFGTGGYSVDIHHRQ